MVALLIHFEMLVRFGKTCDVVCMIGIPNLVNLTRRFVMCVSG